MKLKLASRGSTLALWQARHVADRVQALDPTIEVDTLVVRSTGDRIVDAPLARIGDVGLFTKEIDHAVSTGAADAAVHSLKDLPTTESPGLILVAVLEREDPRDALFVAPGLPQALEALRPGSRVGTSSLRRRALLLSRRPDLDVVDVRGNLDTRLDRLARRDYEALILALAGVRRLGRASEAAQALEPPDWLPAPGQGALAVVTREDNDQARAILARLDHSPSRTAVTAERAWLRRLRGGCQIPAGALATLEGETLTLQAFIAATDGTRVIRGSHAGPHGNAEQIGDVLAGRLEAQGGREIIASLRALANSQVPTGGPP